MHDQAGPGRTCRPRHLSAVPISPDLDSRPIPYILTGRAEALLAETEPAAPRLAPGAVRTPRVTLALWPRQTAEDARQLLYRLAEAEAADLSHGQLAFTLGLLHGAAMNLLDIIDSITEP
jgi:hypothetical protein